MATKLIRLFYLLLFCLCGCNIEPDERGRYSNKFALAYGKYICKKYHMSISSIGGGINQGRIQFIDIDFELRQPFELENTRKFIRDIISELKPFANRYKECSIYFSDQKFNYDRVYLIFHFMTEGESVARVSFIGGKILYKLSKTKGLDELIAWEIYDEDVLHLGSDPGPYD